MTYSEYLDRIKKMQEDNAYWISAKAFDKVESKAFSMGYTSGYSTMITYLEDLLDFVSDLKTVL